MRHMIRILTLSAFVLALLQAREVQARSQRNLAYRPDQTWTTAVRLLRIDMGFEIVERDPEARYIIFTYRQGAQTCTATLEIAERRSELGVEGVTVVVTVPSLPTYVELHLIDQLERKLRREVGTPIQLTPPPAPPPPAEEEEEPEEEEEEED